MRTETRERVGELNLPIGMPGDLTLEFGGGRVEIDGRAPEGLLLAGTFAPPIHREIEPDRIRLWADPFDFDPYHGSTWAIHLSPLAPINLTLRGGAADLVLDLADLTVPRLELHLGAAKSRIQLPTWPGHMECRIESGASSHDVIVPPGVAARIRTEVALGSVIVDRERFPEVHRGLYLSPGYEDAMNRVDIEWRSALASLSIR